MLDIQAKQLGLPLCELLGGALRDKLPVAWTLASGDTQKDIQEAERMLINRRHNIFKLKIGNRYFLDDVKHVLSIKRAVGDQASIRVDVNQAWSEIEANQAIALLEIGGIDLIEQPISQYNISGLKRLTDKFTVPIMADESLTGPLSAFELAKQRASDVFAIWWLSWCNTSCTNGQTCRHRSLWWNYVGRFYWHHCLSACVCHIRRYQIWNRTFRPTTHD